MYQKFIDFNIYNVERKKVSDNIKRVIATSKETGKVEYDRYVVAYHTKYFETDRTFETLERAIEYRDICQRELDKQRFNNRIKSDYQKEILEYPETLLEQLGIVPQEYSNYYDEVLPNFEENWQVLVSKANMRDRELLVLTNYYKHQETLERIGKSLNITRERVRQLLIKATRKAKHYRDFLIEGKEKFVLINAKERNRIYGQVKNEMTKDIAISVVKETCNLDEISEIYKYVEEHLPVDEKTKTITIEDLDFSVRTYNCLKRARIDNLSELIDLEEEQVYKIRNLGKKSLKEIKRKLKEYGVDFKGNNKLC